MIDFHTHIFPDALAPRALEQLVLNTQPFESRYGKAVPHTDATAAGLIKSEKAAGIELSVVMPIATSRKPSKIINDFAAQIDHTTGLRSFGSVHPLNPDRRQELARVAELGLKGIKLHPEYQGCFADSPEVIETVREATEEHLWVLFHAGEDIGMAPPIHCTPEQVVRLRQAVPEARIILAHFGGYRLWDRVYPLLDEMNVWLDTSFCLTNHPDRHPLFAEIIRKNGAHRVLFGSDSPWADQSEVAKTATRFFSEHGFSPAEQQAILEQNARQILRGETPAPLKESISSPEK